MPPENERRAKLHVDDEKRDFTPKQDINELLAENVIDYFCRAKERPDFFRNPELSQPGSRVRMEVVEYLFAIQDRLIEYGEQHLARGEPYTAYAEIRNLSQTLRGTLIGELINKICRGEYNHFIEKHANR